MKNLFRNKIVILILALSAAAGIWFVKNQGANSTEQAAEKKAELYYCPMHPDYTSPKQGSCPICHMDLVLYESGEDSGGSGSEGLHEFTLEEVLSMKPGEICLLHKCKMGNCMIAMTEKMARLGKCPHCEEDLGIVIKDLMPEGYGPVKLGLDKSQLIGISTEKVGKKPLRRTIRAAGTVAHDTELYQAQAEYIEARRALIKAKDGGLAEILPQAKALAEAARTRLRHLGLSEGLIDEVGAQKEPDHGLLYAHAGAAVWVYANVYEYEISEIKPGQTMLAESPSFPGKVFKGTVKAVDAMVDMKTRTTRVRARFENPEAELRPDMFLNTAIEMDLGEVLTVPRSAVLDTGTRKIIFVESEPGRFEPREVILGAAADQYYPVQSGVAEGEKVVTSGNFLIDSESRLKAALKGASQKGGHVHGI